MIAVDTNILVHAHRRESPWHKEGLQWVRNLAEGDIAWGIPVFCLAEFVRVVTHPRLCEPPTSLKDALQTLRSLLESPTLRILYPGSRFPDLLMQTIQSGDARGNLAFDAQIAALCLEQGARLLTRDRDFSRFSGLLLVQVG